ncbi:MAG: preprotein translocase subunit SecE [Ornithinibacter sp.]
MTETSAKRESGQAAQTGGGNPVSRLFQAASLFVRQILDEMRKVVYPTGPELVRYTTVVVVFVMIMMLLVSGFDLGFSKLISWAFTGSVS